MAISSTNLVPLDFETIKSNLKTHLKNQAIFKDVDFEASNISVLIDVLAYNTFHNSFYLNMVASEMFLDTAQLQNILTSHAKMLNYVPRSYRSAKATVDIVIVPENPNNIESILVPKGASFTGRAGSKVFTFTTDKNIVVVNNDGGFVASGVDIYEGRYLSEVFTYSKSARYVISNASVDTTSITVIVSDVNGTAREYTKATSFVDVKSTSEVFFLQPAENGQYEIIFGDNVFGKQPVPGASIIIEYRVSSGELPNTAAVFDSDGPLGGTSNIQLNVINAATGGAVAETVDEVRFRAPLTYATQQRAVTVNDYVTLIKSEFPDISDVGVFGGEDLIPPQFGHVAVAMVSDNYDAVTATRAQDVLDFIKTRCSLTITPITIDPEFSYLRINSRAYYDSSMTSKTASDLQLSVLSAIKNYALSSVNGFNKSLYYSKLLAAIDACDSAMISNDTTVQLYRMLVPQINKPFQTIVGFGNAIFDSNASVGITHPIEDLSSITSSYFTYNGLRCSFEDDGLGKIVVVTESGSSHAVVNANAGTVDYATGQISLNPGVITSYEGSGIRLYATLASKDIQAVRNTALIIRDADITVTVSSTRG